MSTDIDQEIASLERRKASQHRVAALSALPNGTAIAVTRNGQRSSDSRRFYVKNDQSAAQDEPYFLDVAGNDWTSVDFLVSTSAEIHEIKSDAVTAAALGLISSIQDSVRAEDEWTDAKKAVSAAYTVLRRHESRFAAGFDDAEYLLTKEDVATPEEAYEASKPVIISAGSKIGFEGTDDYYAITRDGVLVAEGTDHANGFRQYSKLVEKERNEASKPAGEARIEVVPEVHQEIHLHIEKGAIVSGSPAELGKQLGKALQSYMQQGGSLQADAETPDARIQPSAAEVRAWAREQGIPVNPRGRVHPRLREQYLQANDPRNTNTKENNND